MTFSVSLAQVAINAGALSSPYEVSFTAQTVSAGQAIIVTAGWESVAGTTSVTDTAGNTYTPLTKRSDAQPQWAQMFYCMSSAAQTDNVVKISFGGAASLINAHQYIASHDGTGAYDKDDTAGYTGTTPWSPTLTPTGSGSNLLIQAVKFWNYQSTYAQASGWTNAGPAYTDEYTEGDYRVVDGSSGVSGGGSASTDTTKLYIYGIFGEAGTTPQTAAPTSDISAGSWSPSTGATLYGVLDEDSPGTDSDYISTTTNSDTAKVKFASVTDPAVSTGHLLRYRIRATSTDQLTAYLYQGTTLVATDTTRAPGPTETTYTLTLSGAEADSITDYSDLRAWFTSGTHAGATDTGFKLPTTASTASETGYSNNDWSNASNITADDTNYASITAATFDAGDTSYVLYAKGFDFSAIPDGSTITGVEATVNARYETAIVNGTLAQLLDASGARGGTDMWSSQALTTSDADYTIGGSGQLWGNTLTAAIVKDPDFGIALGFTAGGSGNSNNDLFVDNVKIKVYYTPPAADWRVTWTQLEVPEAADLNVTKSPAQAAATFTGLLPSLFRQYYRQPAQVAATFTGLAPTAAVGILKEPAQAAATFSGLAPSLFREFYRQPAQGEATFTGLTPDLFREFYRQPAQGAATFDGLAPAAEISVIRFPAQGTAAFTGLAPSLFRQTFTQPSELILLATGLTPDLLREYYVTASPASDASAGAWLPSTGSTLYETIDEALPDTGDYDYATTASAFKVTMAALVDPAVSTGHKVSYVIDCDSGDGMYVRLIDGGTTRVTWTHDPVPATPTLFHQELTAEVTDALVNYGSLQLEFESFVSGSSALGGVSFGPVSSLTDT